MNTRITVLPNGLRVITEELPHLETASLGVWVDAGARYEVPETNGVAHMLEHMAFKGTDRRSARQIAEEIEAVGGHLNAYTSREHTAYYAKILKEDVPLALDLLSDILQHSTFDEAELARERAVVLQEIGQANDTPDDIIFDLFQETAYPGQPLGRPILGPPELVSKMPREALLDFVARRYGASRMVLAAAGRIEHEAMVRLAEEAFSALPTQAEGRPEPANYVGGERRETRELEQVHLVMGFPALSYRDDDFYAQQVFSTVLGGGMSSRLFQEVRERRGLAYAIFSFTSSYDDGGLFAIYAGTGEDEVAELSGVVADELRRAAEDIDEVELKRARSQLKASLLMSLESCSAVCENIARQLLIFGRRIPPAETIARIEAVDRAAIERVAGRILTGGRPTVAAIGPLARLPDYESIERRLHLH